ncbi:MAG: DUF1987 domain-containing protein [Spirochaetaceae bacterium]|nr:MAG: DUF1987 domain-containing protein [Spirochaetaceae bacterium]
MQSLYIEPTKSSPLVHLDAEKNILSIQGQSYPENSFQFFEPIFSWIEEYLQQLEAPCVVRLNLDYLNTSSSKCLMDLIDMIEDAHNESKDVRIEWLYDPENDSSIELAEEFKEDLSVPFIIQEIKD